MVAKVNGICLYYQKIGSGPAVILVHGNGEDHRIFDKTAALLSRNHTVYALDSRDHGRSSRVDSISYQDMAEDVAAFVKELQLVRPMYCGFSDGAIVGILAAGKYPKLFSRMVLCGANVNPKGMKRRWFWLFSLISLFDHDPKIRIMLEEPQISAEELERIRIPVLVLAGSHDMIREAHTRYIAAHIPKSRLRILKGEGHGSYIVHSRKLYDATYRFLDGGK